jgi:hypothetical protein
MLPYMFYVLTVGFHLKISKKIRLERQTGLTFFSDCDSTLLILTVN